MAGAIYANDVYSGGTATDRINVGNIADAIGTNNPLDWITDNFAWQDQRKALELSLATGSYSDLSAGVIILRAHGARQRQKFQLEGDVIVGEDGDVSPRDFVLQRGRYSWQQSWTHGTNGGLGNPIRVMGDNAKVVCGGGARIVDVPNIIVVSQASQPFERATILLANNNPGSKIRYTLRSGSASRASGYSRPSDLNSDADTPHVLFYNLGGSVAVRDIEMVGDGQYLWFRDNTWSAPTRLRIASDGRVVMRSASLTTGSQQLAHVIGSADETCFISCSSNASINVRLQREQTSSRMVYLNLAGAPMSTHWRVYLDTNTTTRSLHENHIVVPVTVKGPGGTPIEGCAIDIDSRRPTLVSGQVQFQEIGATRATGTTDANGKVLVGSTDGQFQGAICIEAIGRVGHTNRGTFQGTDHASVAYGSYNTLTYNAHHFGHEIVNRHPFIPALSSFDLKDGIRPLEITLRADPLLSVATAEELPAEATTFDHIYDGTYERAMFHESPLAVTVTNGVMDAGARNIVLSKTASRLIHFTETEMTVKAGSILAEGTHIKRIETTGSLTIGRGIQVTGGITYQDGGSTGRTGVLRITRADTASAVAAFAPDGTTLRATTYNNIDVVQNGTTWHAAGTKVVCAKPGYRPIVRSLPANNGGIVPVEFPALEPERRIDGELAYTGTLRAPLVSFIFDTSNLQQPSLFIDIGDGSVRAHHIYHEIQIQVGTTSALKFLAFGGRFPTYSQHPLSGDSLYLHARQKLRALASGQANTAVIATVFAPENEYIDTSNGTVAINAGLQLSDVAYAITRYDLDPDTVSNESIAGILTTLDTSIRTDLAGLQDTVEAGVTNIVNTLDLDQATQGDQTAGSLLVAIEELCSGIEATLVPMRAALHPQGGVDRVAAIKTDSEALISELGDLTSTVDSVRSELATMQTDVTEIEATVEANENALASARTEQDQHTIDLGVIRAATEATRAAVHPDQGEDQVAAIKTGVAAIPTTQVTPPTPDAIATATMTALQSFGIEPSVTLIDSLRLLLSYALGTSRSRVDGVTVNRFGTATPMIDVEVQGEYDDRTSVTIL